MTSRSAMRLRSFPQLPTSSTCPKDSDDSDGHTQEIVRVHLMEGDTLETCRILLAPWPKFSRQPTQNDRQIYLQQDMYVYLYIFSRHLLACHGGSKTYGHVKTNFNLKLGQPFLHVSNPFPAKPFPQNCGVVSSRDAVSISEATSISLRDNPLLVQQPPCQVFHTPFPFLFAAFLKNQNSYYPT